MVEWPDESNSVKIWLEAECGIVGSNWEKHSEPTASSGTYVTVKSGFNSPGSAPGDSSANQVIITFSIKITGTYNFMARVIGANATDDSYWIKLDAGKFVSANGLAGLKWQWGRLTSSVLNPGEHTLTIAYREDGAKLDKILITTSIASTVVNNESPGTNCSNR